MPKQKFYYAVSPEVLRLVFSPAWDSELFYRSFRHLWALALHKLIKEYTKKAK